METAWMRLATLKPSFVSALTAMRIARAADRHVPDVVEVSALADAMAAVSAKKLHLKQNFKIAYHVKPNSVLPDRIPRDICDNVDFWVFPSRRQADAYGDAKGKKIILNKPYFGALNAVWPTEAPYPTLLWLGEIKSPDRLIAVMDTMEACHGKVRLRICGAGKARAVMPAVRHSRHLQCAGSISWAGADFDINEEIGACTAGVRTDNDITTLETAILLSRRPLVCADSIAELATGARPCDTCSTPTPAEYIARLSELYRS